MKRLISIILLAVLLTAVAADASALTWFYQYKVEKVQNLPKELSTTAFATSQGEPGITISINASKSVSRSYSYTISGSVKVKDVNAGIGWTNSRSDSVSITNGGSWKVPAKVSGKKVKMGILKGYFYYDRVEYRVFRRRVYVNAPTMTIVFGKWTVYKTGCIAKKVRSNDVVYKKTYQYK